MPELFRLYVRSVATGFALAGLFVALLIQMNIGNLGHLVANTADGSLAMVLLFVLNGLVFSGAQMAVAIWLMADDEGHGPDGTAPAALKVPVRTDIK